MTYKQIKQLHDKHIDTVDGMEGFEIGYETRQGHMTDQIQAIFNVRKKKRYVTLSNPHKGEAPSHVAGMLTDVQEAGVVQPRRWDGPYSIQDVQTPWIKNHTRGWRGSGGPVLRDRNTRVMLTNRHVAPDVRSLMTWKDGGGIVSKSAGPDDLLDAAVIKLDDKKAKTSGEIGIRCQDPQIGDAVWMDGGKSGRKRGIIVAMGISKINDEVLGPFRSYSFRIQAHDKSYFAQSGDSGSAVYMDAYGQDYCVGILNGSNARYGVAVPIMPIIEHFKLTWGRIDSVSSQLYRLSRKAKIGRGSR